MSVVRPNQPTQGCCIELTPTTNPPQVISLLEGCIKAAEAFAAAPTLGTDEEDEDEAASPVVPSLAHTWLAKIREQQLEEDDGALGPLDDSGGAALADALQHYEAALACWCGGVVGRSFGGVSCTADLLINAFLPPPPRPRPLPLILLPLHPHHPLPTNNRPENATAAYALARLQRPRITTEAGLADYEELLRVRTESAIHVIVMCTGSRQHSSSIQSIH